MAINIVIGSMDGKKEVDLSAPAVMNYLSRVPETHGRTYNAQLMKGNINSSEGLRYGVARVLDANISCPFIIVVALAETKTPSLRTVAEATVVSSVISLMEGEFTHLEGFAIPEGYLFKVHGVISSFEDTVIRAFRSATLRSV